MTERVGKRSMPRASPCRKKTRPPCLHFDIRAWQKSRYIVVKSPTYIGSVFIVILSQVALSFLFGLLFQLLRGQPTRGRCPQIYGQIREDGLFKFYALRSARHVHKKMGRRPSYRRRNKRIADTATKYQSMEPWHRYTHLAKGALV